LTSALAAGEWTASRPGHLTPGQRAPGTYWVGGWVDSRAGLGDVEKNVSKSAFRFELLQSVPVYFSLIILPLNAPLSGLRTPMLLQVTKKEKCR
jgi:hypothetical protein